MEGEDDRFVSGEQRVEFVVREPVRVLARWLQLHQIDDIDDPDLQIRRMLAQQVNCGQSLQSRHVAAAGHHHIGLGAAVIAGPLPDTEPSLAVLERLVHRQPLGGRLLAGDDDIDVVPAAQAVIGNGQQAVGVRRQIDPDDLGLFIDDVVDEPRVLMAEAVVVLAPDVTGQQVIQ